MSPRGCASGVTPLLKLSGCGFGAQAQQAEWGLPAPSDHTHPVPWCLFSFSHVLTAVLVDSGPSPPLSSSSYMWPVGFCFSVKKEFFFILQACKILLGYIFLQIFFASRSLKGFRLSFAFLYPCDFFISFSSFFCSWNSCRMDVGFCISWLWIFLCFLTLLLR